MGSQSYLGVCSVYGRSAGMLGWNLWGSAHAHSIQETTPWHSQEAHFHRALLPVPGSTSSPIRCPISESGVVVLEKCLPPCSSHRQSTWIWVIHVFPRILHHMAAGALLASVKATWATWTLKSSTSRHSSSSFIIIYLIGTLGCLALLLDYCST